MRTYLKIKQGQRGRSTGAPHTAPYMAVTRFWVEHDGTQIGPTFANRADAMRYRDGVDRGMRLARNVDAPPYTAACFSPPNPPDPITVQIPRRIAEHFTISHSRPDGRTTYLTDLGRQRRTEAIETVRGLVYLQLQRPLTVCCEGEPDAMLGARPQPVYPTIEPKRRKPPREGHPHTILADAINGLAQELEAVADSTNCNREGTRVRRIQKIRETLTALIPE